MSVVEELMNKPYEYFEKENRDELNGKYAGSEWTPYNLDVIRTWIEIRDEYQFTDDEDTIFYGDWEKLDIKRYHSKYGTNYIYIDEERKLWRIYQTRSEFYNGTTTKRKLYDVYFKPAADSVVCVKAYNEYFAKKIVEEDLHNMSKEEIIERIINSMEFGGYELEVSYVEEYRED